VNLFFGIPTRFWTAEDVATMRHAVPGARERELRDASDPPRYESQAAYLARLDLLTGAERKQLAEADFADEVIG
jgi:hypothetical protein